MSSKFWRSLNELENTEEFQAFLEREFPEQADKLTDEPSRRGFMQLMGASLALAGVTGCRWEKEELVPRSRRPADDLPGEPRHFATAMELSGVAQPLLVTSIDGRPIKIEGNPSHPASLGKSSAFAQASILGLYDPDRSETVTRKAWERTVKSTWDGFHAALGNLSAETRLAVLAEPTSSPTVRRLRSALATKFPALSWVEYEPLSRDNERVGTKIAFGAPHRPLYDLDKADVVVTLDSDFLVDHPSALANARGFARRRRPELTADGRRVPMNRLYSIESTFSATGGMADHRLPLRSELMLPFLLAVEAGLTGSGGPESQFLDTPEVRKFVDALVGDLKKFPTSRLLVAGPRQPAIVHALVARINHTAVGSSVRYLPEIDVGREPHAEAIARLTTRMHANKVDALLILGGNPVYDAPSDLDFAGALKKVPMSAHLSEYRDETSAQTTWHLPRAHYLESWADMWAYDGQYTVAQPLIDPLKNGKSAVELLAMAAGIEGTSGEKEVKKTFTDSGRSDTAWRQALHDGFAGRGARATTPSLQSVPSPTLSPRQKGGLDLSSEFELVFTSSSQTYDGRFANNSWLQETPAVATKLCWDNAALISKETAANLGVKHQDMLRIEVAGVRGGAENQKGVIEVPAYVMPGQAPGSIALSLGHGRSRAGLVGGMAEKSYDWDGETWSHRLSAWTPGFDVYPLRRAGAMGMTVAAGVARTGATYELASTQDHWAIDDLGREEVQERVEFQLQQTTEMDWSKWAPDELHYKPHGPPLRSLFEPHKTLGKNTDTRRWAMATDLTACTGCNACAVACQAENNIPVVGKREVMRSREMAWIRIDRYFKGDPANPEMAHQPVACQQCENAPCEQVCPVGATIHTDEGLNDMVYNRCIGTRYCMNNCQYKVRRFNFLHWHKHLPYQDPREERNEIRKLLFNPEVTVRSRGVMEKCTFCVQRIEKAKIAANNARVARHSKEGVIPTDSVQTACQQACPTDAIVFGDLADPKSRVSKLHQNNRRYALLAELNTQPRNLYLANVKNPNPKLSPPSDPETKHGGH